MRTLILSALLCLPALATAAEKDEAQGFRLIHVAELEKTLAQSPAPTLLDANDADFRQKNGVIPGARMLSSFDKFDLAKELPPSKDAPLVFYCANPH